jgi:hypothetical protein
MCYDYFQRSESSGYNIDCNHSEARVHFQYYDAHRFDNNEVKDKECWNQFDDADGPVPDHTTKTKICGYHADSSHNINEYEWAPAQNITSDAFKETASLDSSLITAININGYEDILNACTSAWNHFRQDSRGL